QAVTIDGDTITADPGIAVTIEAVDGGYVLKSASGLYLYHNAEANKLSSTANQSTAAKYPLTISVVEDGVDLALSCGPHMRFNANADQMRFRYYKSTSYANQKPVTLFKLDAGESEPERTSGLVTDLTTLRDGDSIVIFNPANGKTLSTTYNGFYNKAADVTLADGVLTGYTDTDVWTLGINEDGSYTFATAEGKKISMGSQYTSMPLDDVNTSWNITASNTDGCFYIENPVRGAYMEYQSNYNTWSAYYNINDEALFAQQIYLIIEGSEPVDPEPSEPTDPVDPEPSEPDEPEVETATYLAEAPQDGDTVLIYNAANTAVMGAAASGKKLAGVTAAADNGSVALSDDMARLLVSVEGENYIFTLDGKYLTSADTGNGLSFQEELTDMGRWTLQQQESGKFIIMNVGANYNGNYNQALEYYSGFTTYGVKTTDIYMMDFYLVDRPQKSGIITELHEGDNIVIFNPANGKALSTEYTGFYNKGTDVALADGVLTGYTAADVWTVGVNDDGTYTFATAEGKKLSMGTGYSSMPLDDVNTAWALETAKTENCFYIRNVGRDVYVEWYADKNNWSSYYNNSNEALFAQMFYLVGDEISEPETALPAEGEQVVIYNLSAQGVLAAENDTQAIENAPATVENGIVTPANGGVVFTVSQNGNYYRFYNETYGYLCSNGTGNNAFYSLEASEDADWTLLEGKSGGYNLESRTAKYNGSYSQYLEYYADSYKTYSMYNVTDYDIYEFFFYGVAEGVNLSGGIVNIPDVIFGNNGNAYMGQDYTYTFSIDAIFGVESLTVTVNGAEAEYTEAGGVYTVVVTAEQIQQIVAEGKSVIAISISGTDTKGVEFANGSAIDIIDEPSIGAISPAANSTTGDNKRPTISAAIVNAGEGAVVTMTVNGEAVEAVYENGVVSWQPTADLADGRVSVTVTVTRADGKTAEKSWSFIVGEKQYELYFGQLHSHTTYSDGSGSLQSALSYIAGLPESANVDFVAFTDHSNYFDTTGSANPEGALYDMGLASASSQNLWNEYKGAIAQFNASQSDVVAIGGFEMTWSGGPGHINTFATDGIVSRNNATLNNKTSDAGMKAYYALLSQPEGIDSISQFNHPGTTFGNFSDFAYWDALIDTRIQLVEVGNGEGQVGAGGYYPSYEQYTMALDKGWHVAPTNNQDNHKGKWGNANDARDVVLTADFTEEGIYEAIRAYRVYATEDKNLELSYTVNGQVLGSIIDEVPEQLRFEVTAFDPDSSDSLSKVEVIVNSGKVAHTWDNPAELSSGVLTATLAPDYSYYYLRVTEGDGDIAVTAPVWVGETLKLGISAVECGTSTPVTGEELTISTTLFNSELTDAAVKSVTYTVGSQVLAVDTTGYTIPASGSATVDFLYTPEVAKVMNVTVTVIVELDGVEYTFSMDVQLDVQDASKLVYIGIDASHYNEYVAGNYKDSMGNFGALAAGYSVRTVELKTSEELIAACSNDKYAALILTAPSRRLAAAQEALLTYTAEEKAAIKAFNEKGGTVILAGWSDNYENYSAVAGMTAEQHMAATQNALLAELGSSLRITDDATHDNELNGGQTQRLYFNAYNFDSFLVEGVEVDPENPNDRLYTEVYSQYGGATIHVVDENGAMTSEIPATVTPIVFGHTSTYSKDTDNDGIGGDSVPKYAYAEGDDRLMVLASEQIGENGLIIVAGA
ncbi:MAG: CehA/McbA family metallohydrolase, partial [Oscillospiraceae bacterium]|nr:CehA/McbA family metallohydrolase [Oscillospiraceae bacterium]